jgi:hypothetical protein
MEKTSENPHYYCSYPLRGVQCYDWLRCGDDPLSAGSLLEERNRQPAVAV